MNTILISSFIFSFLGSVPPGAINLSLFQIGKTEGLRKAITWGVWAGVLEGIHLAIAWVFHQQITQYPVLEQYALLFSGIILGGAGLYLLKKRASQQEGALMSFQQFTFLNLLNPMAIPFWIGALQLLMPAKDQGILFASSSILGGISCLAIFGLLGSQFQNSGFFKTAWINRSIAIAMLCLSVWQSYQFIIKNNFIILSYNHLSIFQ